MIFCPNCGAPNDPNNRFCDQCGTQLESNPEVQPTAPAESAPQPAPGAPLTCPNCGASVMLGQAFCEECGFALNTNYSAYTTNDDSPTIMAHSEPESAATQEAAPLPGQADETLIDTSMADVAAIPAPAPAPAERTVPAPPPVPEPEAAPEPPAPAPAPTPEVEPEPEAAPEPPAPAPAPEMEPEVPAPAPAPDPEVAPEMSAPAPAPEAEVEPEVPAPAPAPEPEPPLAPEPEPEPAAPAAVPGPDPAEVQRLEGLIAAHKETIAQYEQMQARYPAGAAPAFLTAGLDEARNALAQAEADLAALAPAAGPDPAEVQRLEGLIAAHRETIAQYEQMQARYPAGSAPAFLTAGLDEARNALAQAEADLAALLGQPAPSAPTAAPAAPVSPPPASAGAPTPATTAAEAPTVVPPPAPAPAPGPRLVLVNSEQELPLPTDKTEITVGREDPVSDIYPEIDLTPFGGETGGVSRQHARINQANGQWTITDLNSTNYTRVNGARIEPNTPVPIQDGAQIQFGRIATLFHT